MRSIPHEPPRGRRMDLEGSYSRNTGQHKIAYIDDFFIKQFKILILIPGVRRAIFRIFPEKILQMAGPAAGIRHRHPARVAGDPDRDTNYRPGSRISGTGPG